MFVCLFTSRPESKEHLTLTNISGHAGHSWLSLTPFCKLYCNTTQTFVFFLHTFKVCDKIGNPIKCEVCRCYSFLNARTFQSIEIYRKIKKIFGDASVRKWCIYSTYQINKKLLQSDAFSLKICPF